MELERPDPPFVDDGVEVDVADMTVRAQVGLHKGEGPAKKGLRPVIGNHCPHFPGQFTKVACEEAIVCPWLSTKPVP